jgi:tetratricopeptide (TPR) repeat protein
MSKKSRIPIAVAAAAGILIVGIVTAGIFIYMVGEGTLYVTAYTKPINERPMYGGVSKTPEQKASDERFINGVLNGGYTRQSGSDRGVTRGWESFVNKDYATAMKRFNQAWLLDPDSGNVFHGFAVVVHDRDKNVREAEKCFRMALEKPRYSPGVLLDFGRFLLIEKRPREALPVLQRAADVPTMNSEVFALLAGAFYLTGDHKSACVAAAKVGGDAQPDLQSNAQWVLNTGQCKRKQ